ncbi:hypothetical protein GGX14DRAFT_358967 [Mycena pura]|uniref:Uncharacterized protein n=1 Tax=Mycena pura TaxID=153505 RepID=A0AAD6VLB1_9AGAR|nr:hypothetical protein GGX14DRAFT_358967 [Mycena pura]
MIDPALYTPSKRMRFMTSALATTSSGSFLVSKDTITSTSRLPNPVLEGPPTTIPRLDLTVLELDDKELEGMSKNELLEASKRMRQTIGVANQHIVARDGIIESSHATIVLQNVFCERQSQALQAKEKKKNKTSRVALSMGGLGRHLTDPEWIAKTEEAQKARDAEAAAKVRRAEGREAARIAKDAREKVWKDIKAAHEKAVAAWEERCRDLRAIRTRAKDLPKKPVRPKKPKAPAVEEPPAGGDDDESSSDEE